MSKYTTWWTGKRKARLREYWQAGTDDAVIAFEMGRTARAIACQRQEMGLVGRKLGRRSLKAYQTDELVAELRARGFRITRKMVEDAELLMDPPAQMTL